MANTTAPSAKPTSGSFIDTFFKETRGKTPIERGRILENSDDVEEEHVHTAQQGQSAVSMDVNTHFICFSSIDDCLYELDGRKFAPINHGSIQPGQLLQRAADVMRQHMKRDAGEVRFTVIALAQSQQA